MRPSASPHPLGNAQRLLLVVGDEHGRHPASEELAHLCADAGAHAGRGSRTARPSAQPRLRGQCPSQRDALLLPARELVRPRPVPPVQPGRAPRATRALLSAPEPNASSRRRPGAGTARTPGRPARRAASPAARSNARGPAVELDRAGIGLSKPAMIRSRVVLPHPLGPSRATFAPCRRRDPHRRLPTSPEALRTSRHEMRSSSSSILTAGRSRAGHRMSITAALPRSQTISERRRRSCEEPDVSPTRLGRQRLEADGASSSVTGSSFIAVRNTSVPPSRRPAGSAARDGPQDGQRPRRARVPPRRRRVHLQREARVAPRPAAETARRRRTRAAAASGTATTRPGRRTPATARS